MDDAGAGLPNPMDRRYTNEECWKATLDYVNSAKEAERLGFDSFWTTEHHFQYEGYEVIPNGLLISTWIAAQTTTAAVRSDVQRGAAVESDASRRGLRHVAQPVGWPGDARRRPWHRAARGAAPQRQGRVDRIAGQPRSAGGRPVSTGRSSRSRWRSSGGRSTTSRSRSRASTSRSRCRASPTAGRPCRI